MVCYCQSQMTDIRETPASCGTDANCHCPRMVNSKRQADQYASAVSLLYLACRLVDFKAFSTADLIRTHTYRGLSCNTS